jgi:hypothetical protein
MCKSMEKLVRNWRKSVQRVDVPARRLWRNNNDAASYFYALHRLDGPYKSFRTSCLSPESLVEKLDTIVD